MSVKEELIQLKETKRDLEKKRKEIELTLKDLNSEKNTIIEKERELNTRGSSLAKELLKNVRDGLENVERQIANTNSEYESLKKEIEENQINISIREDDAKLYIYEQCTRMVADFNKYVEDHLEEIGMKIKKTFYIVEEMRQNCRQGLIPTGNIGIVDNRDCVEYNKKDYITISNEFYLKNKLYYESWDGWHYEMTKWYESYREQFTLHLLEVLEKNCTWKEYFKLTIEDSCFTLELV